MSYRWAVLAAGTFAQAAFSTLHFAIAVLAPALREEYDLSLTEIGIVLAAEWVGLTFALLPWGFAVDRFGERWTVAAGLALCGAFLVGAAHAPSFEWLVAFLGLAGVAGGSVQSGSGRAVMGWFAASERGLALGVRQTAVPLGGVAAAIVLPLFGTPRAGLLFVAGFVLVGAVAAAVVLRAGTEEHIAVSDVESTLRDPRLWIACWGSGFYLVAQVAMMGFVVLFLHDEHGFSTAEAAAVFGAGQALAGVLRIAVGRWSDVVGTRVGPLRLIGVAIGVALAAVAATSATPGFVLVPVLALALAMSMAWNGLSYTIAAELGGRRSGAAIGFQQTVLSAIGIAAPVGFAAAVSATSWGAAFALAALFPLAGVWLLRSL